MHKTQGNYQTGHSTKGETTGAGQHQSGQQMGQYVNPSYGAREYEMLQKVEHMGNQLGNQVQTGPQTGQTGQYTAGQYWPSQQAGQNATGQYWSGQQTGQTLGTQAGQGYQIGSQIGQQSGYQIGAQMGQQAGQQSSQFGALEIMEAHEVITDHIDGINQFELYRPHVKDQTLMQVLDNQINHMYQSYQHMVNYLHNQGMGTAVPYRAPITSNIMYGLRQPLPVEPNTSFQEMDDRDVASGMLGCAKASALVCTNAALECANPNLRIMFTNCAISSINQAYELFLYMNQRGMYQVPTLAQQTTQTMINTYQTGSQPQFR